MSSKKEISQIACSLAGLLEQCSEKPRLMHERCSPVSRQCVEGRVTTRCASGVRWVCVCAWLQVGTAHAPQVPCAQAQLRVRAWCGTLGGPASPCLYKPPCGGVGLTLPQHWGRLSRCKKERLKYWGSWWMILFRGGMEMQPNLEQQTKGNLLFSVLEFSWARDLSLVL